MKQLFMILLIALLFATVIGGQSYWNERNQQSVAGENETVKPSAVEQSESELQSRIRSIPDAVIQEKFNEAAKDKKAVKIVMAGSNALGNEEEGVAVTVQQELEEAFGEDFVQFSHMEYAETSLELLKSDKLGKLLEELEDADLLIYEPLTLNDNGKVRSEDSLKAVESVLSDATEQNKELYVILQPPHPLHHATYYPKEVDALSEFAKEHTYTYVDHWQAWPDSADEELKTYLQEDRKAPSKKGIDVWSKEILRLFGL